MRTRDYEPDDIEDEHEDWSEDDDDLTIPCPHCREPVFDAAEQCPGCGHYLSREDAPWRKPWWLVVGVVVCLIVVLSWYL